MNEPIRQHYVPKMILKRFTDDGCLFVYDKKLNKSYKSNIKNIAVEKHFYSIDGQNEEKCYIAEKLLSQIEKKADKIMNKIETYSMIECLTNNEKKNIAIFVAIQLLRTPYFRYCLEKIAEEQFNPSLSFFSSKINQFRLMFNAGKEKTNCLTDRISSLLISRRWRLWFSFGEDGFVCSDNPVSLLPSEIPFGQSISDFRITLETPGVIIAFPISKKTCLIINDTLEFPSNQIQQDDMLIVNNTLASSCHRFFYANKKAEIERLGEYIQKVENNE